MPQHFWPSSSEPHTVEKTLVTTGVEDSVVIRSDDGLPAVKKVLARSRTANAFTFAYVAGGPYVTVDSGQVYWDDGLDTRHLELFLVGSIDGQVIEVLYWL